VKNRFASRLLRSVARKKSTFRIARRLLLFRRISKGSHWTVYYSYLFPSQVLKVSTGRGLLERQKYRDEYRESAIQIGYCDRVSKLCSEPHREIVFQKYYGANLQKTVQSLMLSHPDEALYPYVEEHVRLTLQLWDAGLIDFDARYSNFGVDGSRLTAIDSDMIGTFETMSEYDFFRFVKRFWAENWLILGRVRPFFEEQTRYLLGLPILVEWASDLETCQILCRLPIKLWHGELPPSTIEQLNILHTELLEKSRQPCHQV